MTKIIIYRCNHCGEEIEGEGREKMITVNYLPMFHDAHYCVHECLVARILASEKDKDTKDYNE